MDMETSSKGNRKMSSTERKGIAGRLEWLTNVQTAIKGLIGTFALLVAGEGIALYSNPNDIMQLLGVLEINTHFWNIIQNGVPLIALIIAYYFTQPIEIGIQESKAKMWFLSLKKDYTHIRSILDQEEGKIILADLMREGLEILNKQQQEKEKDDAVKPEITIADTDNIDIVFNGEDTSASALHIQELKTKLQNLQKNDSVDE